jgi:hypothetical protein
MERHYGPEGAAPRPRPQDSYSVVTVDGLPIGLAWVQAPSSTTRAYGFGLFPECRKLGHGVCVKQALIDRCFEETLDIHKVEAEVIGANLWSLKVLHGIDDIMTEEGRVRESIQIDGQYYDRIFFGITRAEWNHCLPKKYRTKSKRRALAISIPERPEREEDANYDEEPKDRVHRVVLSSTLNDRRESVKKRI